MRTKITLSPSIKYRHFYVPDFSSVCGRFFLFSFVFCFVLFCFVLFSFSVCPRRERETDFFVSRSPSRSACTDNPFFHLSPPPRLIICRASGIAPPSRDQRPMNANGGTCRVINIRCRCRWQERSNGDGACHFIRRMRRVEMGGGCESDESKCRFAFSREKSAGHLFFPRCGRLCTRTGTFTRI